MDQETVYAIGQAVDSTWGRSSTTRSATWSIKASLINDHQMKIVYSTIGTFASERGLRGQLTLYEHEGRTRIEEYIKHIKGCVKDSTGKTLKIDVVSSTDDVEFITTQPHISAKKDAYYRLRVVAEVK